MPDTSQDAGIRAWAALLRCHAAVVPSIAKRVERQTGLPLAWYDVLLELQATADGRLRMQELGERVVLSRSRVSRVVDDMSTAGLVQRRPDPTDRRGSFAVITASGRKSYRGAAPVYARAIHEQFTAHLTPSQLKTVAIALEQVTDQQ
jgi:DNA-binding MarR family transcriptional regulator